MLRFLTLISFLIVSFSVGCTSSRTVRRRQPERKKTSTRTYNSRKVPRNYDYRKNYKLNTDRLMAVIRQWKGTPYCLGGSSKKCTDCSGFVQKVYKNVCGAKLPRVSKDQFKIGKKISRNNLTKGDLVFFALNGRRINHVGIYIGEDKFAHASTSRGVMISSLKKAYFKKRFVGARRLF